MSRVKIAPDMLPGIYERAGKGDTLAAICGWLEATYGVQVSPTAVRKKLAKQRAEREVVAKAVVRERIAKTVTIDLECLEREGKRLRRLATLRFREARDTTPDPEARGKTPTEVYCVVVEQLRKLIDTKLHYAGADAPDDAAAEFLAAERRLTSGMAGVQARLRAAGVPEQPDPGGTGSP